MSELFMPTEEWPLQEIYKEQLHKRIQKWGEFVTPVFEGLTAENRQSKEQIFQWLMECVERNDRVTAEFVDLLDIGVREKYVHGDAFDAIKGNRNNPEHNPGFASAIQNQFLTLYDIFQAGVESTFN